MPSKFHLIRISQPPSYTDDYSIELHTLTAIMNRIIDRIQRSRDLEWTLPLLFACSAGYNSAVSHDHELAFISSTILTSVAVLLLIERIDYRCHKVTILIGAVSGVCSFIISLVSDLPLLSLISLVLVAISTTICSFVPLNLALESAPSQYKPLVNTISNMIYYVGATVGYGISLAMNLDTAASLASKRYTSGSIALAAIGIGLPVICSIGLFFVKEPKAEPIVLTEGELRKKVEAEEADEADIKREIDKAPTRLVFTVRDPRDPLRPTWGMMLNTNDNRRKTLLTVALAFGKPWTGGKAIATYFGRLIAHPTPRREKIAIVCCSAFCLFVSSSPLVFRCARRPYNPIMLMAFVTTLSILAVVAMLDAILSVGRASDSHGSHATFASRCLLFVFFVAYNVAMTPMYPGYPYRIWHWSRLHRSRGMALAALVSASAFPLRKLHPDTLERWHLALLSGLVVVETLAFFCFPNITDVGCVTEGAVEETGALVESPCDQAASASASASSSSATSAPGSRPTSPPAPPPGSAAAVVPASAVAAQRAVSSGAFPGAPTGGSSLRERRGYNTL